MHIYEDGQKKVWQYGKPSNGTWHNDNYFLKIFKCLFNIFTQSTRENILFYDDGKQSILYKTVCDI